MNTNNPSNFDHILYSAFFGKTYHQSSSYDPYVNQSLKKLMTNSLPWHPISPEIQAEFRKKPNVQNEAYNNAKFNKLVVNCMFYGIFLLYFLVYLNNYMTFGNINLDIVTHITAVFFIVVLGFLKYAVSDILPPIEQVISAPNAKYLYAINYQTEKTEDHIYANIQLETGYTGRIIVNEAADGYIIVKSRKGLGIQPCYEEDSQYLTNTNDTYI